MAILMKLILNMMRNEGAARPQPLIFRAALILHCGDFTTGFFLVNGLRRARRFFQRS